jgi:hypothetical protein
MQSFDNRIAKMEGWEIAQIDGCGFGEWVLRRLYHSRIFLSDDDAWTHVINQAVFAHDLYHLAALKFLEVNSYPQFEMIEAHAAYLGISNGVTPFFHLLKEGEAA